MLLGSHDCNTTCRCLYMRLPVCQIGILIHLLYYILYLE